MHHYPRSPLRRRLAYLLAAAVAATLAFAIVITPGNGPASAGTTEHPHLLTHSSSTATATATATERRKHHRRAPVHTSTSPSSSPQTSSPPMTQPPASAATTTNPPPSTSTAAVARPPTWVGNYDNGTLSQFQSTSWNNVPTAPAVVSSPAYEGGYAGKYVIPAGGSRCENVPSIGSFSEGDDYWFGWSTMLGGDFPLTTSGWQVVNQWKNDGTGSPPLELKVANGQFALDGGYGYPSGPRYWSRTIGPARANVWDRWTIHITFSSNASVGTVDLWRNGTQVISGLHPAGGTLYPGMTSYLKVGYYRDPSISSQGTVYHDDWKMGTTQAAVSP